MNNLATHPLSRMGSILVPRILGPNFMSFSKSLSLVIVLVLVSSLDSAVNAQSASLNLVGDWRLHAEKTAELLKVENGQQAGDVAGKIPPQMKGMQLRLDGAQKFKWTIAEGQEITGSWKSETSKDANTERISGKLILDPDNLPAHEIMMFQYEFLDHQTLKAKPPRGLASVVLEREPLPNGIYLIQRWTIEPNDLWPLLDKEEVVKSDPSWLGESDEDEVRFVTIDRSVGISLDTLDGLDPVEQSDGRINLNVTFPKNSAEALEAMTRKYLGRQITVVIGGRALTIHKIRSIIKNCQVTISRCTDDGCQIILQNLQKK